jgi:tRNA(fMet)-specific endonuclease VapC
MLMNGEPSVTQALAANAASLVATSIVVQGELAFMAENALHQEVNLVRVRNLLDSIAITMLDEETAYVYGHVKATLLRHFGPKEKAKRRRTTLQQLGFDENDLWIAATALRHDLTVVSTDTDFSRIQETLPLKVERWHNPPTAPAHP